MPGSAVPARDTGPVPPRRKGPRGVVLAILVVVVLEAAAMITFAGAVLVELVSGRSTNVGVGVFVVVFFLGLAWLLVGCVRALWRGRRRGRSPVAGWQIFQGIIGVSLLTGGSPAAVLGGLVLLLLAVGVLLGLMTRPVLEHTTG
ncbi:hypothetical protein [Isoptericola croceus]|uniref:hypothetical protein n=1 Tax=Isoptericola croceus TaxID=3031406 RepID=UPI0023FA31A1|nr:hypothetical protein [Isoptericola croceus]